MRPRPPAEFQIPFDRITYREGQRLASRDQQDDIQANDRLRRMHTRFLHQTWGIALGLTVQAQPGDDSIHVGPGYAIDRSAREILLARDLVLPVPHTPAPAVLMLVAGYQPDAAYSGLPDLAGLCAGSALDPREEEPLFNWRTPDTLDLALDVPLAAVHAANGALIERPDLSVRRYAARIIRPHIGSGMMEYTLTRQNANEKIIVDTRDAGFAHTPQYMVRIDARGFLDTLVQFVATSAYIDAASPKGFRYVVPGLAAFLQPGNEAIPLVITWLGVEPVAGCEPQANLFQAFTLDGFLWAPAAFAPASIRKKEVIG